MRVSDPDTFGGTISIAFGQSQWVETDTADKVFGRENWPAEDPLVANYRGLGLAEMACAIAEGRPHRASAELSVHTLAVLTGIVESAERGMDVDITEPCQRPNVMSEGDAKALLANV